MGALHTWHVAGKRSMELFRRHADRDSGKECRRLPRHPRRTLQAGGGGQCRTGKPQDRHHGTAGQHRGTRQPCVVQHRSRPADALPAICRCPAHHPAGAVAQPVRA